MEKQSAGGEDNKKGSCFCILKEAPTAYAGRIEHSKV